MDKSVKKFLVFLEAYIEDMRDEMRAYFIKKVLENRELGDVDRIREKSEMQLLNEYELTPFALNFEIIKDLIKNLKVPKDSWYDCNAVYSNFKELSELLVKSELNTRERFDIVRYLLEKNLCTTSIYTKFMSYEDFLNLKLNGMTQKQFREFLLGKDFVKIFKSEDAKLTEEELEFKEKITSYLIAHQVANSFIVAQNSIKRHYIDKLAFYNEKDILVTTKAFRIIGISSELCESFEYLMKKEVQNRSKTNSAVKIKSCEQESSKEKMSQKEYNHLFRIVESYYDIQNQKVIKPLSLDEIIYLVSLMYKLNISETEIIKFIKTINKDGLNAYQSELAHFNAYYEKMISCSDNDDVKNALTSIKEYMQEMFIPENNNDYLFWKNEIANEMKTVIPILNQDYVYELNEGRKLNK